MMRNHGNRKAVSLSEQLAELFKAQVMRGIRPETQRWVEEEMLWTQSWNKMEEKEEV